MKNSAMLPELYCIKNYIDKVVALDKEMEKKGFLKQMN